MAIMIRAVVFVCALINCVVFVRNSAKIYVHGVPGSGNRQDSFEKHSIRRLSEISSMFDPSLISQKNSVMYEDAQDLVSYFARKMLLQIRPRAAFHLKFETCLAFKKTA